MRTTAATRLLGVIGHPARHSLSPVLQGGWLEDHGIDAVYLAFDVPPTRFGPALAGLREAGVIGLNVTLPHKEAAFAACGAATRAARRAGAVNTLVLTADGPITGDNTDGAGLLLDLDSRAPGWRDLDGPAVVFGSGGAARGIAAALSDAGRTVRLVVRTRSAGLALAAAVGLDPADVCDWNDMADGLNGAAVAINATSRGLKGTDPFTPDFGPLRAGAVVYDTVYAPRETAFLAASRAQGRTALDGLGMLAGQGALAFRHWFGVLPDVATGLARLDAELAR